MPLGHSCFLGLSAALLFLLCPAALPQGIITTIAGTDFAFPRLPLPAENAPLGAPVGLAVDADGNVFVSDPENHLVLKIAGKTQILSVFAGNGIQGFSGEGGPADRASLAEPNGLCVDRVGNLYIADMLNTRIRKVTPDGSIVTVAGSDLDGGFDGDGGPASSALLDQPYGVAVDNAGAVYIADTLNHRIRKVGPEGTISTIAGSGPTGSGNGGFGGDGGLAVNARLDEPHGVAVDGNGVLYIADTYNNRVRRVTPDGVISTIAGTGEGGPAGDGGPATAAQLDEPRALAFDLAGNLLIVAMISDVVRKIAADGTITTVAGNHETDYAGDGGPATAASLHLPQGIAVGGDGAIFIADTYNRRVRRVSPGGTIDTLAGNGISRYGGDGGPAELAVLNMPEGLATGPEGSLYVADSRNHRIRKITADNQITTVAGAGRAGLAGDGGPATDALLFSPHGVAIDAAGGLLIADSDNGRVRRVSPDGQIIATIAGTWDSEDVGNGGPATAARLGWPVDLGISATGDIYIADYFAHRIRKVLPDGTIETAAGSPTGPDGTAGSSGDGAAAIQALLNSPNGVAVDSLGQVWIADTENHRIRRIDANGMIATVAGGGEGSAGSGGIATDVELDGPEDVAVDGGGAFYIADTQHAAIRKVSPGGVISTVAGGDYGYDGDGGPATEAALREPTSVALDNAGNIFIADTENSRIRAVLVDPPVFDPLPLNIELTGGFSGGPPVREENLVLSARRNGPLGSAALPGLSFSASVESDDLWLKVAPMQGRTPRRLQIVADPANLAAGEHDATLGIEMADTALGEQKVNVRFLVGEARPPKLLLDGEYFDFTYTEQSVARSETLVISNDGSGELVFSADVQPDPGANWLSLTPDAGTATPATPAQLTLVADPAGLPTGTYTAAIRISSPVVATVDIPVTMTIASAEQVILLSQTGLSFQAEEDGGVVPPQSFGVLNLGSGVMGWTISTETSDGGDWIEASSDSDSTTAGEPAPSAIVSVDQSGLAQGVYYGTVIVTAPDSANKAQVVTVFLDVAPAGSNLKSVVDPPELAFSTSAETSPSSLDLFVYNISETPRTYRTTVTTDDGDRWLFVNPGDGLLDPERPTQVVVQPDVSWFDSGELRGTIAFQFSDGTVQEVKVRVAVASDPGNVNPAARLANGGCIPQPALTSQIAVSTVPAGWPVALQAAVEECGQPMTKGKVYVQFSTGDPVLYLTSLNSGIWEATWTTQHSFDEKDGVKLTVTATSPAALVGSQEYTMDLRKAEEKPLLSRKGVVSAASFESGPLAPGGFVSIFGERLSEGTYQSTTLPLPKELGETVIFFTGGPGIGLLKMPILLATDKQANAIVPDSIPPNTIHQIYVRRGLVRSLPVYVTVAESQPAVFLAAPGVSRQGHIYRSDGTLAGPGSSASAGEYIVLWCSGLGTTDPPVPAGTAAPATGLAETVNQVRLTIGGANAQVVFSGLAPGFANLYQVNAIVPGGVAPGDQIDVLLDVAGQQSSPVTMSID
jgi:uncharacterized protein (TIGR03437 family)